MAPVCVGEQQNFTCSISGLTRNDFLHWNVTTYDESGRGLSGTRLLSAAGQAVISPIVINMKRFNISGQTEILSNGSVTLTSVLLIDNITHDLNGTMISCTVLRASGGDTSFSTTSIHIIGAGSGI